jgi:hypothetical protein
MDKTGLIAIILGIAFILVGGYAIMAFLPQVIMVVQGLIGICVVLFGLMILLFGILIIKD